MVSAVFAFSDIWGKVLFYSTVTLLARFRGLSISQPSHKSYAFAGTL